MFFKKLFYSSLKKINSLRELLGYFSKNKIPSLDQLMGRPKQPRSKAMLNLPELLKKYQIVPHGVIHVGAHEARELEEYLNLGFAKILYVEANPVLIPLLKAKAAVHPGRVFVVHAAACDYDGEIDLRVTSMNQSSSILKLGKHREIYPSIQEVNRVRVNARRLETILAESGLEAKDFNFLNLDIQGAELLALKGAGKILESIEAINTEINLVELYQGGVLLKDLEVYLESHRFNRAAMATPYHQTWGDAFYLRRPVAMTSHLGSDGQYQGRFANQLFHYLFLQLVATRQRALVQTPHWIGQEIFEISDPAPVLSFPVWREDVALPLNNSLAKNETDPWKIFYQEPNPDFTSTNFSGYFQGHTRNFSDQREFVLSLFKFRPDFLEYTRDKIAHLRSLRPRILAVHLRRGDFGANYFFRAPCIWYEKWIQEAGLNPAEWIIYICSENPRPYRDRFPGFKTISSLDINISKKFAAYFDFYVMTQADYVMTANSSYSFMATLLNSTAQQFTRPCAERESMIAFDPWNAPVLFKYIPTREDHLRFRRID